MSIGSQRPPSLLVKNRPLLPDEWEAIPSAAGEHRPSSILVRGTSPCRRLAVLGRRSALAAKRSAQRAPQSGQAGPSDRHSLIFIVGFLLRRARGAAGRGRKRKGEEGDGVGS